MTGPSSPNLFFHFRLGVKLTLSTSWKSFAFTHPLMLLSTSPREVLFACLPLLLEICLPSLRSPLFPPSDPPFSRQGAALAHLEFLPSHNLVLWTDGSVPFYFGKGDSGVLANCSLCGTEATLFGRLNWLKFFRLACAILQALRWSQQHQQIRHFSSLVLFFPL